jgi:hypothetical protein
MSRQKIHDTRWAHSRLSAECQLKSKEGPQMTPATETAGRVERYWDASNHCP